MAADESGGRGGDARDLAWSKVVLGDHKRSNLFSGYLCALHVVQWPPALQGSHARPFLRALLL